MSAVAEPATVRNSHRICCLFPTGIRPDYIVLRRIYLSMSKEASIELALNSLLSRY